MNIFKIFGILLEFFENSLDFLRGFFCGIDCKFFGNCKWLLTFSTVNWFVTFSKLADCLHFESWLIIYIFKVSWFFTFQMSADNKKLFEYGWNWFECQDFGFCQDFVSMEKKEEISIKRRLMTLKKPSTRSNNRTCFHKTVVFTQ